MPKETKVFIQPAKLKDPLIQHPNKYELQNQNKLTTDQKDLKENENKMQYGKNNKKQTNIKCNQIK